MNEKNAYNYINLGYLEMMSDGDESMKKVMLEMLLDELPQELQKLRDLLNAASWEELGAVSHKLKSTLAFVGNADMTTANRDIELLAKEQQEQERIPEKLDTLEAFCPKVLAELKIEFSKL